MPVNTSADIFATLPEPVLRRAGNSNIEFVVDLDRKALVMRIDRRTFGHGPGFEHAAKLQAEIVVKPRRIVLLDHEVQGAMVTLFVGLIVFLPSQMSIVDDVARRWTDIIWTGNKSVRDRMQPHQANRIYYGILAFYVIWSFVIAWVFLMFSDAAKTMTMVIANVNNVALGFTAFHILYINRTLLPKPLRPRWYSQLGIAGCGVFYLGMAVLVFQAKIWPLIAGK